MTISWAHLAMPSKGSITGYFGVQAYKCLVNERFHWDGSPKDEAFAGFGPARTMRLHRSNRSTTLRRDSLAQCRYCGLPMEYFDRYDHGRIPMMPMMVPAAAVPERMRWSVMQGVAVQGDGGDSRCYVPHPAFCPAYTHHDKVSDEITRARARLRARMEQLIAEGFVPDLPPADEDDVAEQYVEPVEGQRHVVAYANLLWLAPGRVDTIQCVARAASTGERCRNRVSQNDGVWGEMKIPYAAGRAGQDVLWAGTTMWVYELHTLQTGSFNRWMRQRCVDHAPGANSAPDAVPPQWVHFHPLRHDEFILRQRPAQAEPLKAPASRIAGLSMGPERTECATPDCRNGSVSKVPEGWLCWKCERAARRRQRTHLHFVSSGGPNSKL
ncbi:hypothetical protein GCM10018980_68490 [Streptomyces capoamus]|uniref:Uncharacterized protein n=1 Tax=Streptomyces capoamus TaxID=68183 RepID=A0A919F2E4_9ACTN|nr:DUF6083 domain-containing protein [Streptomyces capoamus]GGP32404.1 hypothetical protein GCM10010501_74900 [Streptomyces libani subsp. rufus]GHG72590.1 hypothetical protein GCM10018980_68490 [Streptomyces capoamus]